MSNKVLIIHCLHLFYHHVIILKIVYLENIELKKYILTSFSRIKLIECSFKTMNLPCNEFNDLIRICLKPFEIMPLNIGILQFDHKQIFWLYNNRLLHLCIPIFLNHFWFWAITLTLERTLTVWNIAVINQITFIKINVIEPTNVW